MIDMDAVIGFDWDEGNALKSEVKHGVLQAETEEVFGNQPLLVFPDAAHSERERRMNAMGQTDAGRMLQVTFTFRRLGKLIRVISARDMSRKERKAYAKTS